MKYLTNQVALVTGASRGLGQAIAVALAAEGATIAAVARSEDALKSTLEAIRAAGGVAEPFALDVADSAACEETVTKITTKLDRIDILVNNAGVTRDGLLMRMADADWDTVLDTNLKGAFLVTKAFVRSFIKQRSGRIINISSVIGLIGNAGQANYAASKAGLIGFTQSAARELASRGITVNAIAPGFIETDMTAELTEALKAEILKKIPLGCLGQSEDIAAAALYLAGPGARYVTGQVLTVDGGMVM